MNTGAEAEYPFDGGTLKEVKMEEGSSWGGGGCHISNSSRFSYQNNRVSQIDTSVNARGEEINLQKLIQFSGNPAA